MYKTLNMSEKLCLLLVLLFTSCLAYSQIERLDIREDNGPNPWSSLDINSDDDQFQFVIVTDRTGGHRPGVFEEAVQKINLLQPEFVMSVGDLIEGYTEDTTILNAEWNEFTGFIDGLEMPFFYVPGNHDYTNEVMGKEYLKRFGRDYYHFIYKDVLFLCLNSEDQYRGAGKGTISAPQFDYISETLTNNSEVKYTFVFLHQPLWIQEDPKYWGQVETLLNERPHTVFAGHYHHYVKRERNNGKYVMLATTGGGSRLRGKDFGEFDHVVWVTMTAAGPVVANLWLQGIWDENVSTELSETFIKDLMQSQVVEIAPTFDLNSTTETTFKIKLSNHFDLPLTIDVEEGFGWDQWITVDSHQIVLPPNSVEWITGSFHPRRNTAKVSELRATPIKFNVSATLSDSNFLVIPLQVNLKPLEKIFLASTRTMVEVDGNIDDWKLAEEYSDIADNKFRFDITHNNSHLFIMAEVLDDTIVIDKSTSVSRQDNITLSLSIAPALKSARSPVDAYQIRLVPQELGDKSVTEPLNNIPEDWRYICHATKSGYIFEAAIPIKYLDEAQGGSWQSVRLNWNVDDLDDKNDWQKIERNSYYPAWGSDTEILGAGIYFRKGN